MAQRSDLGKDVTVALDQSPAAKRRAEQAQARRVEALTLKLGGLSYEQIGERLGITKQGARDMIKRSLATAEARNVDEERELENARLDRAQAAIWPDVLKGDLKAVDTFLRISRQRAAINGLNAATKVDLAVSVKQEMVAALDELENLVLQGEVIESRSHEGSDRDSA